LNVGKGRGPASPSQKKKKVTEARNPTLNTRRGKGQLAVGNRFVRRGKGGNKMKKKGGGVRRQKKKKKKKKEFAVKKESL